METPKTRLGEGEGLLIVCIYLNFPIDELATVRSEMYVTKHRASIYEYVNTYLKYQSGLEDTHFRKDGFRESVRKPFSTPTPPDASILPFK